MMFDFLLKFDLIVASMLCVGLIWGFLKQSFQNLNYRFKRHRGRSLVMLAQKLEPWLYYNEVGRTTAICRVDAFDSMASFQKDLKPWEPLKSVRVRPTFLFRRDELLTKIHVKANYDDTQMMIDDLVQKLTGYSRNQVDKASFEKATKAVIRKNTQLFVPFAVEPSDEEGERLMRFYGTPPSFPEVRTYLLGN